MTVELKAGDCNHRDSLLPSPRRCLGGCSHWPTTRCQFWCVPVQ